MNLRTQETPLTIASNVAPVLPRVYTGRGRSLRDYTSPTAFVLDFLAICAGAGIALGLYKALGGIHVENELFNFLAFSIQYALAFILFGRVYALYSYKHSLLKVRDTAGILRVSTFCFLLLAFESVFSQIAIPRLVLALSWLLITFFVLLEKHTFHRIFAKWKAKEVVERKALILGSGAEARRLFSFLLNSPELKLRPTAFFEEQGSEVERVVYSHDYRFTSHATVYSGRLDAEVLQRLSIAEIFMADPTLSPTRLSEISQLASEQKVAVSFVAPAQVPGIGTPVNFRVMDGLFVTSYSGSYDTGFGYVIAKRMLDIGVCMCMFLVSLPVWIVAAVWIKLSSEGPIFFQQDRIGMNGESFKILKFRSMYTTAPKYGRSPECPNDPRITSAGRMERSFEWIVTALGTMLAGAAYIPLDAAWPQSRLSFAIKDSGASILVARDGLLKKLQLALPGIDPSRDADSIASSPTMTMPLIIAESLAYVIYTSGSTAA